MRLALFEPDIPQNAGALLRLGACLGIGVDIVEPCGFLLDDRRLRRAGMDYLDLVDMRRHSSWVAFRPTCAGRLVLLTTRGETAHTDFRFEADDTILVGRESSGVPEEIHRAANARLRIPMVEGARSLNVALAAAIVLGHALTQTQQWPNEQSRS